MIEAVITSLSDQDKEVRIDSIKFAVRMAFDGNVTVDIINNSSSLDTDKIRGQIDWPFCIRLIQDGIKDDNNAASSWLCAKSFLSSSKWLSYYSEPLTK
jgi:hypothetical protein